MDALLKRLFSNEARRGFTGSRAWAVIAVATGTARVLRHLARPKTEVVWRQALQPGDRFEVTVVDPKPR